MNNFKVGDKVKNGSFTGTIVQIKELPTTTSGYAYLIKYPIREVKCLFHRKFWTGGLLLKKIVGDKDVKDN